MYMLESHVYRKNKDIKVKKNVKKISLISSIMLRKFRLRKKRFSHKKNVRFLYRNEMLFMLFEENVGK